MPFPGCHLCFWSTGHKLEVPIASSLCLIIFLEELTELKETFHIPDHQFTIKWCNSGTARWKRWTGHGMWKGYHFPKSPCAHHPWSSQNPILFTFRFLWSLCYLGMMDKSLANGDQFILQPLSRPQTLGWGCGTESPNLPARSFPWSPVPIIRCFPKVTSWTQVSLKGVCYECQDTVITLLLRKFQGF